MKITESDNLDFIPNCVIEDLSHAAPVKRSHHDSIPAEALNLPLNFDYDDPRSAIVRNGPEPWWFSNVDWECDEEDDCDDDGADITYLVQRGDWYRCASSWLKYNRSKVVRFIARAEKDPIFMEWWTSDKCEHTISGPLSHGAYISGGFIRHSEYYKLSFAVGKEHIFEGDIDDVRDDFEELCCAWRNAWKKFIEEEARKDPAFTRVSNTFTEPHGE